MPRALGSGVVLRSHRTRLFQERHARRILHLHQLRLVVRRSAYRPGGDYTATYGFAQGDRVALSTNRCYTYPAFTAVGSVNTNVCAIHHLRQPG